MDVFLFFYYQFPGAIKITWSCGVVEVKSGGMGRLSSQQKRASSQASIYLLL